jgi:hypothetical protein
MRRWLERKLRERGLEDVDFHPPGRCMFCYPDDHMPAKDTAPESGRRRTLWHERQ